MNINEIFKIKLQEQINSGHITFQPLDFQGYLPIVVCFWKHSKSDSESILQRIPCSVAYHDEIIVPSSLWPYNFFQPLHFDGGWWKKYLYHETDNRLTDNRFQLFIVFVRYSDIGNIRSFKKYLRDVLGNGKFSVHFSDPDCHKHGGGCDCPVDFQAVLNEAQRQLNLVYHKPTRDILKIRYYRPFPAFDSNFQKLRKSDFIKSRVAIHNGAILSILGLRDSKDIDLISYDPSYSKYYSPEIGVHNSSDHNQMYLNATGSSLEQLIQDPKNFFYFNGFKALLPQHIINYKLEKINSGMIREKDMKDIQKIENFLALSSRYIA